MGQDPSTLLYWRVRQLPRRDKVPLGLQLIWWAPPSTTTGSRAVMTATCSLLSIGPLRCDDVDPLPGSYTVVDRCVDEAGIHRGK